MTQDNILFECNLMLIIDRIRHEPAGFVTFAQLDRIIEELRETHPVYFNICAKNLIGSDVTRYLGVALNRGLLTTTKGGYKAKGAIDSTAIPCVAIKGSGGGSSAPT